MKMDDIRTQGVGRVRAFLEKHKDLLSGRVLDYGCGESPYRAYVSGEYVPYDEGYFAKKHNLVYLKPEGHFDVVLLTAVIQFVPDPLRMLRSFDTDHIIMTFIMGYPIIQDIDYFRYTLNGMRYLLGEAGYDIVESQESCWVDGEDFHIPTGFIVLARKR